MSADQQVDWVAGQSIGRQVSRLAQWLFGFESEETSIAVKVTCEKAAALFEGETSLF